MTKAKKSDKMTTLVTPRGIRVTHENGDRDYLRIDSLPAARKALQEGETHPWVRVAVEAYDQHLTKIGGSPW